MRSIGKLADLALGLFAPRASAAAACTYCPASGCSYVVCCPLGGGNLWRVQTCREAWSCRDYILGKC